MANEVKGFEETEFVVRKVGYTTPKGAEKVLSYPPVQGTHENCFRALSSKGLAIEEGNDLTMIAEVAYNANEKSPIWSKIKRDCFVGGYTRVPVRMSFNPSKGRFGAIFPGVLVQRDLEGKGINSPFEFPTVNNSDWQENDGIYVHKMTGVIYVPEGKYFLGEHKPRTFEKDGLARAVLRDEGTQRYARIGKDKKLSLKSWGVDTEKISEPVKKVAVLGEYDGWLGLGCYYGGDGASGFAFGCVASQKIKQ